MQDAGCWLCAARWLVRGPMRSPRTSRHRGVRAARAPLPAAQRSGAAMPYFDRIARTRSSGIASTVLPLPVDDVAMNIEL